MISIKPLSNWRDELPCETCECEGYCGGCECGALNEPDDEIPEGIKMLRRFDDLRHQIVMCLNEMDDIKEKYIDTIENMEKKLYS